MSVSEKIADRPQRKLLSLDGGGIRGVVAIEVLASIEGMLRSELGEDGDFRLSHYFDYVGGTSTGAILAACIALGMSVAEIRQFYNENGRAMFAENYWPATLWAKYRHARLAKKLKEVFDRHKPADESGDHLTLGSSALQTLLLVVLQNATTNSPWPLSNNPGAKYNQSGITSNLHFPLWQIVRASTAAPTYFSPERIRVGPNRFVFVDGGMTPYNNPAFLLFLMATMKPFKVAWPTGEDRMLLVSIGTGTSSGENRDLDPNDMHLLYSAKAAAASLMHVTLNEQDMLCRTFGRCLNGAPLDSELGELTDPGIAGVDPLFTYLRYNAELTDDWLHANGLSDIRAENVQSLDSVRHLSALRRIGQVAGMQVRAEDFRVFL